MAPVTVIIPAYNAAGFLPDAIASVHAQRHPVAEVLVVDDRSSDGTPELARSLGARVVVQPENRGPSAARNAGLREASTELVAFLDADDAWLPWHIQLCVGALAQRPRAALACTASVSWAAAAPEPPRDAPVWVPDDAVVEMLERSMVAQSAVVARRETLAAAGGYDEGRRHAEDYDLWMRLIHQGHDLALVRAPGLRYRTHADQATTALRQMYAAGFDVRLRVLAQLAEARGDGARLTRARAAVVRALDQTLAAAWYAEDEDAFAFLLGAASEIPGGAPVAGRWVLRRRLAWHAYHALRDIRRRLRSPARPRG